MLIFATEKPGNFMNADLLYGLIMLMILGGAVSYIIKHGEANKKRQDEEYDKIKAEYDKAEASQKEKEITNK